MEALARVAFGLFGLAVLVGLAWLFSSNKKSVDWKLVATGVTLQIAFAALVLLVPGGKDVFDALGRGFVKLLEFTGVGTQLMMVRLFASTDSSSVALNPLTSMCSRSASHRSSMSD